jgi:ornithine carbamoyltransferase
MTRLRHLLDVDDLTPEELVGVLDLAESPAPPGLLARRGVALLFEKPSARTRNAAEVAVAELGGHPVSIRGEEVGLDVRETVEDVARTLSLYHAAIGARVFSHATVARLAAAATVPVINLLSDRAHPCQALADLLTIRQRFGGLAGVTLAYVGDFNNVARSLAVAAAMCGMRVRVGAPAGYGPSPADHERVRAAGAELATFADPREAASGADVVYTDVWTSMGQEAEAAVRRQAFAGFTVDAAVMAAAAPGAVFMHCLPAHRGEEVAAEVIDGPQSAVWQQAANRLHAHRGMLRFLLEDAEAGAR